MVLNGTAAYLCYLLCLFLFVIKADFTSIIALKTGSVEIVREISAVIYKFDKDTSNLRLENKIWKIYTVS